MRHIVVTGTMVFVTATALAAAAGQHDAHQAVGAGQQTPVDVAQCAQAQGTVARLIDAAKLRLEGARQTNSAAAMRDAIDDLQAVLVDLSAQLAPCAAIQATAAGPHAGHAMPTVQQEPAAAPGKPATQPGAPTSAPGAVAPTAPAPGRGDPHAGHAMPAAPTRPGRTAAPAAPRSTQPAAPAATTGRPAPAADRDTHAGHATPTAPAPSATSETPGSRTTRSADLAPSPPTDVADLKCRPQVDRRTAPRMLHEGRMYYFCSEQERAAFANEPGKYAIPAGQAAPAHGH